MCFNIKYEKTDISEFIIITYIFQIFGQNRFLERHNTTCYDNYIRENKILKCSSRIDLSQVFNMIITHDILSKK